MDDFLHNLRSGKLKQSDRQNRPYGDPQYKNKRNLMDRRKREFESKESFDRLNAIKEILELVAETQKQMAKAYEIRTKTEERKAGALEILAKSVYRMAYPNATDAEDLFPRMVSTQAVEKGHTTPQPVDPEPDETLYPEATAEQPDLERDDQDNPDDENRQELFELIRGMREDRLSWEKIARQITAKGYPTISGRGSWRGVMVKNLYEKMTEVE